MDVRTTVLKQLHLTSGLAQAADITRKFFKNSKTIYSLYTMRKTQKKPNCHCFQRWSRTPYAAFNSMHKLIKIGVLKVSLSIILMCPQCAYAQTDSLTITQMTDLDELLIVGQREDALPLLVRTLVALTRTEIERAPALTINELLRTLPSLDIRQRSPMGIQADISVRGGNFDQTQILLNGVNFSDPQTGHYSLDIPIELSSVTKIEILQGLSAPGAIGGALNIITGGGEKNTANFSFSGGQHAYLSVMGNTTQVSEKWTSFLSASYRESKGYIPNTDFRNTNLYSYIQHHSKIGKWEAQMGYQDKPYGAHGFYSFTYPEQFEHVRTLLGSLRWKKETVFFNFTATAYHRTHFDRFELFRNQAPEWYAGHNYHQTAVSGGEFGMSFNTLFGQTNLSAELRKEHIFSNVLGHAMNSPKPVPFEGDRLYTHEADRTVLRTLFSQLYEYQNIAVNAGLSFHYSNDFGGRFCLAGDVRYKLNRHLLVYMAANQSLRLPTFTDLFYNTATHQANPELKPEEAMVYEVGEKFAKNAWSVSSSVFFRQGKNIIDWVYTEGASKSQSQNYSVVNAAGGGISLQWNPALHNARAVIIRQLSVSYTYTLLNKENTQHTSSYVLDYLKHKVNINMQHLLFFNQLKASWNLTFYDRAGTYVDNISGLATDFRPFVLTDARLAWDATRFTVFAEANNLFCAAYFDYGGLLQPKCWITTGILLKL